jgi:hypothetical protein
MEAENREKVLERLATTEKATLVIERQPDEKYLSHQALGWQEGVSEGSGAQSAQGRGPAVCLSKRARRHDEWDPPVEPTTCRHRAPRTLTRSSRKRLRHDRDNAVPVVVNARRTQVRDAPQLRDCGRPRRFSTRGSLGSSARTPGRDPRPPRRDTPGPAGVHLLVSAYRPQSITILDRRL